MSIRINVGATFDARDIKAARRELDALEDEAKGLNTKMAGLSRTMAGVGRAFTSVGSVMTQAVTLPILGAAGASVTMAANFSESMSKIVGLVGIAADEVKSMESAVLALSGETAKAPIELSEAFFVVTSAGLRGADALNALEFAAKAGSAGLGETRDIARAVAGAMNAYGAETLDAARATDIIVGTARAGNFATEQFAGALGRVLPFAKQAQASLEDVGGAVALLTRTNGNAARSITQLENLFAAFVTPTEQTRNMLDELGLSAEGLRERMGREGLVATLKTLDRAVGGNREELGRLLATKEAGSAAFQILDADADALAGTFGVVTDSVGMTQEAFDVVSDQAAFKFRAALNDLIVVGIELGATLLPMVTDLVDGFRDLVERFNDLTPAQRDTVIQFGVFIAAIGPALSVIGLLSFALAGLTAAISAVGIAAVIATGGVALLLGLAGAAALRDMFKTAEQRAAEDAAHDHAVANQRVASGYYEMGRQARIAAGEIEMAGSAWERGRAQGSAAAQAQNEARRFADLANSMRDVADEADDAAAAVAGFGDEAGGTSEAATGGAVAKVVSLTSSMRDFFRELNETNVGLSDTKDMVAQFSREVLAAGNITEETARGAELLARTIRQDIDKALAEGNRRLDEAVGKFNAYRDAIAGGIRSGNTIADAVRNQTAAQEALTRAQEAYEKAKSGDDVDAIKDAADALKDAEKAEGTFLSFLETGVTTAEGFAAQIDAVREAGASMEVVRQIAELGAKTGGRIAAELLAGGTAAIENANRMVTAVENASRRAGESAAQQFFGAGVNAARAMVRGIEATIPELQSVLDRIAEAIERALGTRPNVDISGQRGSFIPSAPSAPTTGGRRNPPFVPNPDAPLPVLPGGLRWGSGGLPNIPMMADGGIVTSPTFAMIGEAGPEAVIPLDRMGGGGNVINVTVTSADPQAVVEALRRYTRGNGPLGQVVTL